MSGAFDKPRSTQYIMYNAPEKIYMILDGIPTNAHHDQED
jgi:hypothetical protein